jgi:hypothetical protein
VCTAAVTAALRVFSLGLGGHGLTPSNWGIFPGFNNVETTIPAQGGQADVDYTFEGVGCQVFDLSKFAFKAIIARR